MSMNDQHGQQDVGRNGDERSQNLPIERSDTGESPEEEELLQEAAPKNGEEVPLPPPDDTPLEIPAEIIRDEIREAQENGEAQQPAAKPEPYIVFDHISKSFGDL